MFILINLRDSGVSEVSLYLGINHDTKYGKNVDLITETPVGVIEIGFSSQEIIRELCKKQKYFVRRLKNNQNFKILEDS